MDITVVSDKLVRFGEREFACAIGKAGFVAAEQKKEGDHKTPIGRFALRQCLYRADRVDKPKTHLATRVLRPEDGWCDAPLDKAYNTHVILPYDARHERLWRAEAVYDVIVPLGYNDAPVVAGAGSAIFMHVAKADYAGTEGCVALKLEDLLWVLENITPETAIDIAPQGA